MELFWALLTLAAIVWALFQVLKANLRHNDAQAAKKRQRELIAERADQQHARYLQGHEDGLYGMYPPSNT